jgi:hypothetical protein
MEEKHGGKSDERNLRPVRERICQGRDEQASGELFEKGFAGNRTFGEATAVLSGPGHRAICNRLLDAPEGCRRYSP